jgi:hypothetical protein
MSNDLREVEHFLADWRIDDPEDAAYRKMAVHVLTRTLYDAGVVYGKASQVENSQTRQQAYGYPSGFTYFTYDPDMIRFWCIVAAVPVEKFYRALDAIRAGKLDPKKVKKLEIARRKSTLGHRASEKAEKKFNDYIQQAYN